MLISPPAAMAKGSDIRFRATVVRVDEAADGGATVTVRLQSVDVGILANADTEIESQGDEVGLDGLSAGAFVKIAGFFSADGIVAEEIDILDTVDGQFRLRGAISAVGPVSGGTLITLLGVDVLVNEDTEIQRRGSDGELTTVELAVGMVADARGIFDDNQLFATRLKIGSRESDGIIVEFEGTISAISGGTLLVDTEGGGAAAVVVTDSTRVKGTLEVARFIEVKGTLNESLAVVASVVKVDDDGDRDADDDNPDREENARRKSRREVRLVAADGLSLEGEVETEFLETTGGPVIQELEIAFHDAPRNAQFSVSVMFAVDGSTARVDFGTVTANGGGRVKVKFRTNGSGRDRALTSLLPVGRSVKDISSVEIRDSEGKLVMTGTF
jgi:hypothetical protein